MEVWMSRNRVQRSAPRRGLLGAAAFAVLVAGLVGPAGTADAASTVGLSPSCSAGSSLVICAKFPPQETLGVRWQ
jgi:hypothetical protein